MAYTLHLPIDTFIGEQTDEFGFVYVGFTASMLDWFLGYDYMTGAPRTTDIEKVVVHINSPGGDVTEGFAIYNKLLALRENGVVVETLIEGECYSMATVIALAATPGKVKAREASMFMVHKPWGGGVMNADEARKYADYLDSFERPIVSVYAAKTGKSAEEIEALLREEKFMNAEEAKAWGFIDEVITVAAPATVSARGQLKAVAFYNPKSISTSNDKMKDEEKKSLFAEFKAWMKGESGAPKAEGEAPAAAAEGEGTGAPEVVAASTTLEDGASVYFEGELAQGSAVFSDAEMLTALEDGTYTLTDGRSMEVVEGQVANLTDAEEEEAEASAAEAPVVAQLKKQIAAMATAHKAQQQQIKALTDKINDFVPGGGNSTGKPEQRFTDTDNKKVTGSAFDAIAGNAKRKRN